MKIIEFKNKYLVIFTIISAIVLVVATLPRLINPSPNTVESNIVAKLNYIKGHLDQYKSINGNYPPADVGLKFLLTDNFSQRDRIIQDPWNSPLVYKLNGEEIILYSIGSNKIDENGRGDDVKLEMND